MDVTTEEATRRMYLEVCFNGKDYRMVINLTCIGIIGFNTSFFIFFPRPIHLQQKRFRDGARGRDGACAISGFEGLGPGESFLTLHAAHIFHISREETWLGNHYNNWIIDDTPARDIGVMKMH